MTDVRTVRDGTFEDAVLKSAVPVLVDFWAPWCGPCKAVGPMLEELAREYGDRMGFARMNVEDEPMYASKYGISSIPTMLLFKDGQPVGQIVGLKSKSHLRKAIEEMLT
ncbi:MAG: thioredoxin [Chloroflexota bacterium]